MAYFKISLLTPQINNQKTFFLEDIITEFDTETDNILDLNDIDTKDLYDTHNNDYHDLLVINNKRAKHNTSYTYNEKISFSQNAQKTLTFDLNRYVLKENEWAENPFSHLLTEGTQLLVVDQYKNEYFFTITSTKFNIRENNIVYNITCQDSFSYQVSRQNDGYTIENDPNEVDFIGAKTVDWWVLKKIVPECYLTNYTYLSCNTGLYEDKDGIYHTFKNNESIFNVKRIVKEAHTPPVYDIDGTIIKENDIDYFDRISFSCSGINANAALIQLGEQIKMQIATFEHAQLQRQNNQIVRTNYFDRYFWFEPMKNDQRIGLTYSPTHNIKNFDLTHQGQSLTTVLNVNGPTYDNEIVTLLPDVPEFFLTYFNSSDWSEGSYTPGLFSQLCKNRVFINTTDTSYTNKEYNNSEYFNALTDQVEFLVGNEWVDELIQDQEATHIRFPIYTCLKNQNYLFSMPPYYSHMNFRLSDKIDGTKRILISNIIVNKNTNEGTIAELVTANTHAWKLLYVTKYWKIINNTSGEEYLTNKTLRDISDRGVNNTITFNNSDGFYYINNKITNVSRLELPYNESDQLSILLIESNPFEIQENISDIQTNTKDVYCYIVIDYPITYDNFPFTISQPQLYLNFFRNFTQEEIEFAEIADECPWLENKLIDFNYFKNSNIISKNEYDSLMNIILNQLRRVNGSLMFYARGYYKALQERTKMLAELLNNLDSLGAACQAAVIDPMASKGRTSEENRQYFDNAYSLLMNAPWKKKALLRYDDVITDYFNKYFNSQQRFLKNIYNFRQYFNAPYISTIPDIYGYKLNIVNDYNSDVFYTFDQTIWTTINDNFRDYAGAGAKIPGSEDFQPDNTSLNNYGQPYYTIYKFLSTGNKYIPEPIASKDQLGETLYVLPPMSDTRYYCNNEDIYNNVQYAQVAFKVKAYRTGSGTIGDPYKYHLNSRTGQCIAKSGTTKNYTGLQANVTDFEDSNKDWDGAFRFRVTPRYDTDLYIDLLCWASPFTLVDSEGEGYYYFYQLRQGMFTTNVTVDNVDYLKAKMEGPVNLIDRFSNNGVLSELFFTIQRIKGWKEEEVFSENESYYSYSSNVSTWINFTDEVLQIVNASKKDLIENWILNQKDYSNILRRITPVYTSFPDEAARYSNGKMTDWLALQELADICYKSVLTIERDDEDNDDDKESIWKQKNKKQIKDKARRLYYKNLPITDAYKMLPQFRYEEETDSYGNISYLFKQVNKAGQSIKDYINYKTGKSSVPVTDPYDGSQQIMLRVPYVTPLNEGSFYRKVMHTPKANYAWFAWLLIPPVPGSLITRAAIAMTVAHYTTYYNWDLEGNSARDIYHHRTIWKWSGYWDRIDDIYNSYDKVPNDQSNLKNTIYPMYTVSSDTMEKIDEYNSAILSASYQQFEQAIENHQFPGTRTFFAEDWNDNFLRIPIQKCSINEVAGNRFEVTLTYDSGLLNFFNSTGIIKNPLLLTSNSAVNTYKATNIGYTFRDISSQAQFIDTIYEPLQLNSNLYKNDRYTMIIIQQSGDDIFQQEEGWLNTLNSIIENHADGLSGTLYYPLTNQMIPLDMSSFDWVSVNNVTTVNELLSNSGRSVSELEETPYIIGYDDVYVLIFRARDYKTEQMSVIYNDFIKNYSTLYKWYDKRTHDAYDFTKEPGLAEGFYRMPDTTIDLEKTSSTDIFDIVTGEYYTVDGVRIYTIKQLPSLNYNYYYIKASQKDYEYALENQTKFPTSIIRNIKIWDENKQSLLKIEKEELNNCYELNFKDSTTVSQQIEGYINWIEKTFTVGDYSITVQRGRTEYPVINLKGLTNGSFWYYYHHDTERPLLFEQAAAIETQLTEYWTNAYYASKGCEYFLPEYWTEAANQENNFFNKNIYVIKDNTAILSNYYLPEVKIYTAKENSAISPQYHFFYRSSDTTVNDINKNDITDDETIFNANTVVNQNPAYYYAFRRLMPEDDKESNYWLAEKIGTTTYYYVDNINSGMLWEDFVGTALKRPNAYQEMSGNYVMGYRLLRKYYYNNNFTQYKALQKQHDQIWKTLYENYGFLILENSYNSETATNSNDLLTTAKLYFADRKIPERAYNINVIDTASLENYDGAEIRIGDGIRINAKEYYDEYDLVYQSLSQYLFITDISYTLRNTADINLTVNNVKYEEGIIKRLAKLIK